MYRQNSEKSFWVEFPPPPPATLVHFSHYHNRFDTYLYHCSLCCKNLHWQIECRLPITTVWQYKRFVYKLTTKHRLRDSICASSLAKFLHLRLKTPIFLSIFMTYCRLLCYIHQRSQLFNIGGGGGGKSL